MFRLFRSYTGAFRGLSQEAWMLSLVMLINRSGSMVLPFLGVYMTDHLKIGLIDTGIILSFYGVGSVMGSLLGGWLTDKYSEYRVQSWSLFLSAPLFLIIPLFTSLPGLAGIIWLQSLVSETFRPANSVAVTKYTQPQNITRAFSLNRMAINLGFSIGPALGGILSVISYNLLFIVNAIAALLAGIMYVYFFRKRHKLFGIKLSGQEGRPTGNAIRSPYRDGLFVTFCLLCAVFAIFFFQFFNTIPIFYKEVAGLSSGVIGYILAYSGFVIVLLEMQMVNLAERHLNTATTLFMGGVAVAASFGLLAFSHHIVILLLSMTLLSLGEILVLPFIATLTAKRSNGNNTGAYMGLNGMAFSLSFIVTPFLGTNIAGNFGFNHLWVISWLVLSSVALGFYFLVKRMYV
ncbi:MAG: MFS transporter [Chitinophagaceae bacterium]|nr:MFS transporter [Chitinophagaceae bacterium]MCW5926031.1 MFS transporter [Chitinophagaceae bacterium]